MTSCPKRLSTTRTTRVPMTCTRPTTLRFLVIILVHGLYARRGGARTMLRCRIDVSTIEHSSLARGAHSLGRRFYNAGLLRVCGLDRASLGQRFGIEHVALLTLRRDTSWRAPSKLWGALPKTVAFTAPSVNRVSEAVWWIYFRDKSQRRRQIRGARHTMKKYG